jgi:hypothetical protein
MTNLISQPKAMRSIEDAWGGSLPKTAHVWLEEQGYLQDVQASQRTPQEVANIIATIWKPNKASPIEGEDSHGWSISVILFLEARQEEKVKAFREKHLPDGLLPISGVGRWIKKIAKTERPLGAENRGLPVLEYESKENPLPMGIAVSTDGVLDELLRLCEHLTYAYGWEPAEAASFVLSDGVPEKESIRATVNSNSYLPFISHITLEINPAMSEQDVAKAYTRTRDKFFKRQGRTRRQSIKHQTLGAFYARNVVYAESQERRERLMERWNDLCVSGTLWKEKWQYGAVTNFQRDGKRAYTELVRDRRKEVE